MVCNIYGILYIHFMVYRVGLIDSRLLGTMISGIPLNIGPWNQNVRSLCVCGLLDTISIRLRVLWKDPRLVQRPHIPGPLGFKDGTWGSKAPKP